MMEGRENFQHRVGITKSEERANVAAFATFTGDLHPRMLEEITGVRPSAHTA